MQIADKHIKEFQVLYQKHFGVEISTAEALTKGIRLIRLMEIVSKHEAKKQAEQTIPAPITN